MKDLFDRIVMECTKNYEPHTDCNGCRIRDCCPYVNIPWKWDREAIEGELKNEVV